MRLAAPIHDEEIAPRFCCARTLLIMDVGVDSQIATHRVPFPTGNIQARIDWLVSMKVQMLVCGGFNRRFIPLAEGLGLQVFVGAFGAVEPNLMAALNGELRRDSPPPERLGLDCAAECQLRRRIAVTARGRRWTGP